MNSSCQTNLDEQYAAGLGLALVDFHNFMPDRGGASRVQDAAAHTVEAVADTFADSRNTTTLDIRLYGGWLDEDGHPSPNAQTLLATLPYLRGRRRGMVVRPELAMAMMVEPSLRLHGTVRLRSGRRREKMVDQMIGCDAMFLAKGDGRHADVAVFSGDDDLVPPLLMAHSFKPGMTRWVRKPSSYARPNDKRLRRLGLLILEK